MKKWKADAKYRTWDLYEGETHIASIQLYYGSAGSAFGRNRYSYANLSAHDITKTVERLPNEDYQSYLSRNNQATKLFTVDVKGVNTLGDAMRHARKMIPELKTRVEQHFN